MKQNELVEAYIMLSASSDEELKSALKSTGRIEDKNLDLSVTLLRKMLTDEGREEIVKHLVHDDLHPNGCNGAVDPAIMLLSPSTISELTYLYANDIKGTDLYTLWNDCGKRNMGNFVLNIWALQSGVYKPSEVEENFRINHIHFQGFSDRIVDRDDQRWFNRASRAVVFPFVYNQNIINPRDYIKDLHSVGPMDDDFKSFVRANRAYQRLQHYLCQSGLSTTKKFEVSDKDEITVSMVLPTYTKVPYEGWRWIQEEEGPLQTFALNTNQLLEIIADRPASKHYDLMNRDDSNKAIHFLRHSKKQFLPGLAVIRSLPQADVANYYSNNNAKRYGELVKLGGYTSFNEQEGLVKLGYTLGLFSPSETQSKAAQEYLKQHIIGKVESDDLHKLYGAMDLQRGFDKDFADFFMIHHSQNPQCFKTSEGVDMTEQIYANFDKILTFRPEKEIKTTTNRLRLTPEDAIAALSDTCCMLGLPPELAPYVNVIGKYTSNPEEILWAVEKLKVAKNIPEEQVTIPYVEDSANAACKFRVLKKGDPEVAITGRKSNCCFKYQGASHNALEHAIVNPNSSVVVFESQKGYTQGWVWYDEKNGLLVIDNLEGVPERDENDKTIASGLGDAVLRYADQTIQALNEKGLPCNSVNLGTRYLNKIISTTLEKYEDLGLIKDADRSNVEYPRSQHIYTDAAEGQFVISNEELLAKHAEHFSAQSFADNKEQ